MRFFRSLAFALLFLTAVAVSETALEAMDQEILKNLDFFYYMEVVEAQPALKVMKEEEKREKRDPQSREKRGERK